MLRVLEEIGLSVDFVAGTGMGGLVGGLYASGYSADSIAKIAESLDWNSIFQDPVDRRDYPREEQETGGYYLLAPVSQGRLISPGGLIASHRIEQALEEWIPSAESPRDFDHLNRPFVAIARDAEAGEMIVLNYGVLATAMRAAVAMASVFPPVRTGGRLLEHGGLSRPLPAQAALQLGADVLVCSDVTYPLGLPDEVVTFFDRFASSLSSQEATIAVEERQLCDVLILPDVASISTSDYDHIAELIAGGVEAARRSVPYLERFKPEQ